MNGRYLTCGENLSLAVIKRYQAFITVIALLLAQPSAEATYVFFYRPENITGISGRAFANNSGPDHQLNISLFGAGSDAVSKVVNWQVGDFTGAITPAPLGNYQRGVLGGGYGSTAVQMAGDEMGGQLHTASIPGGSIYPNNLACMSVHHNWNADYVKPWTHATSQLRVQFNMQIPAFYMIGGALGYINLGMGMQDENGKSFWFLCAVFDTRGAPSKESIGWDKGGTSLPYASSFFDCNVATRYCSRDAASYWSTSIPWSGWHRYGCTISRQQLLNIINDLNTTYGRGYSTNVSGYRLTSVSLQDEIKWPTGNGWLPMGVKGLSVFEEY
jgi:hypothetical protein